MLTITVPATELYDEKTGMFINTKEQVLQLEHSLISLSKWESKWHKPFYSKAEKTAEETLDYVKCMTLNKNVDPNVFQVMSSDNIKQINDYISDPMTATTFTERGSKKSNSEITTSELIYYWMIALNIPSEYEKWHLNRLLTLIRICNIKNEPPKKMSKGEIMRRNKALNEQRLKKYNTTG